MQSNNKNTTGYNSIYPGGAQTNASGFATNDFPSLDGSVNMGGAGQQ
jgi:hypothetical protein